MGASLTVRLHANLHSRETIVTFTSPPLPTLGALLAGGASRRMGSTKADAILGGRALAAWSTAVLEAVCRSNVQIGGEPIADLGWPRLEDLRPDAGPGAGIETALLHAPGMAVVICPVDMPFVPAELLRAALEHVEAGAIAAAPHHGDRWHPLCGACSPALLPHLTAWLDTGRRNLQGLFDRVGAVPICAPALAEFGAPERLLSNINTPAALAQANTEL